MGSPTRMLFITGTDTGVGKTVLTALLLAHLRSSGIHALALKPFCSGSRGDASLLGSIQDNELSLNEINPCFFAEPLSPLAAARRHHQRISLNKIVEYIERMAAKCQLLLVEGVGGLLVPLSEDSTVLDLIVRLNCEVLVVARNRLGTLNHTLLTVRALQAALSCKASKASLSRGAGPTTSALASEHSCDPKVILMEPPRSDASTSSNARLLTELLHPVPVFTLPFLGPRLRRRQAILSAAARAKKQLTRLLNRSDPVDANR